MNVGRRPEAGENKGSYPAIYIYAVAYRDTRKD